MKIYLDLFFLLNAGMNFVILLAESFFCHHPVRVRRLALASALGALFSCFVVMTGLHRVIPLLIGMYFVAAVGILRVAFGRTTIAALVRNVIMFYLAAFVLAGLLLQVQKVFHLPMTGIAVLAVSSLCLLLLKWFLPRIRRRQEQTKSYYRIRLCYGDVWIRGMALLDTGNGLYDPISRQPVLLGNASFLTPLLQGDKEPIMRIIPFHSIGKKSGLLQAFQAETLEVESGGVWKSVEKPWVAVCDECVSVDGEYEVILHPGMLINEKKKEDN